MGPQLVQHLDGSEQAKERLTVILETLGSGLAIEQACQRLGLQEAMFHRLRMRVLQAGLADLEPRLRGRPRREVSAEQLHGAQLEQEVERLQDELELAELRHELAQVLPHLQDPPPEAVKKTTAARRKKQQRRRRAKRLAQRKAR